MIEAFEVKLIFEAQFHENQFEGIINRFHPSPYHELEKGHQDAVESRVQELIETEISSQKYD